ncbi:WD40 repeat domain-containing protein [Pedobacter arcticus]|uniref:WD40 repeat domain-containing protein n=1 Tax=Pedobacter arcticus TaxID=752140 RepID=UPI0002F79930|nr:WD40 repeat domain-containing protein [Pedobacter arcticus]
MKTTTLSGHSNPIYAVISHPTESLFYTAGNDKGIVEWDLNSKSHKRVFKNVKRTVYALEIIPELNTLYAGCNDGNLLIFDLETTALKTTLSLGSAIFSLKYISEKEELICTTEKGLIFIISTTENELVHQFQSGYSKVRSAAIHEKLNLLATVSNDEYVRIYNLDDFTLIQEFQAHENGIGSVKFSPDGAKLITGGRDAHLNSYNVFDCSLIQKFPAHLFAIYQIVFHPSEPFFATASRDKSIKIWRSADSSLFKVLSIDKAKEGHILSVNDIAWSNDGQYLLSVGDDKFVKIWEFNDK